MIKNEIIRLIENKPARVGVIGLGYVGLPLATEFAGNGFQATGFEVDENKAAQINAGDLTSAMLIRQLIKELVESKSSQRHHRFRSPERLRRDHHLRAHAAAENERAGRFLHPGGG